LFAAVGSVTADDTVAVFTRFPVLAALTALTVTTYVTDPPLGIVIPVSLMFPVPVASKPLAPADPVAVQLGVPSAASKLSTTVASVTFDGPLLLATIVYVSPTPGVYVAELSVFVIVRSATLATVSVSDAVLLPGVGSLTGLLLIVAVLIRL